MASNRILSIIHVFLYNQYLHTFNTLSQNKKHLQSLPKSYDLKKIHEIIVNVLKIAHH